MKQQPLLFYE